jgi:hypothetical protein
MILAGVIVGTAFAGLGTLLYAVRSDLQVPLAIGLGAVTLLYALSESGFISLPVPGRSWQVPADWVREGFYRSAVIFGGTVGFGVFTRIPYASFPIMLAWLVVSGNVLYGAITGLAYGAFRAASIYSSSSISDTEALVNWNQRIMAMIPSVHVLTGVALAAFGLYLVIAPVLD